MNTIPTPCDINLGNWRDYPNSCWSFSHLRQLIPTANIQASRAINAEDGNDLKGLSSLDDRDIDSLLELHTDGILVLKDGKKQWQWQAPHFDSTKPHIVFSVSKSITAMVAGCLWGQGLLDRNKTISHYLPKASDSAYGDCSLQQLLDMQVSLDFVEDYADRSGDFFRYRNATGWNPVDQTKEIEALEAFLYTIKKGELDHGEVFAYRSPNSDLLALLIERVASMPYAQLLSELIWQPMGAKTDGYVTVDNQHLARGAGGVCATMDDLARFGQLVLDLGGCEGRSVIPESWVVDTFKNGNQSAWKKGNFVGLLPEGNYRNKWYQVGDEGGCLFAVGIHGQWLFINPTTRSVIVKLSSQREALHEPTDVRTLKLLIRLSQV